jgi:hypothetical protein
VAIPTVHIPQSSGAAIPTVNIPAPTATPTATPLPTPTRTPLPKKHKQVKQPQKQPQAPPQAWIWAFLTSYCPGSAGWLSASGLTVFYGMLANDYYTFGTKVYLPVLGMTGVVEDRTGAFNMWNHFDVWSPTCYSTPTGWFKVAVYTG